MAGMSGYAGERVIAGSGRVKGTRSMEMKPKALTSGGSVMTR